MGYISITEAAERLAADITDEEAEKLRAEAVDRAGLGFTILALIAGDPMDEGLAARSLKVAVAIHVLLYPELCAGTVGTPPSPGGTI